MGLWLLKLVLKCSSVEQLLNGKKLQLLNDTERMML